MSEKRSAIIGVGNLLLQDEGVGIHLLNILKEETLPEDIDLIDGGTAGVTLLTLMEQYERVFILDAVELGLEPGRIMVFSPEEIMDKSLSSRHSLHSLNLLTILNLAKSLGKNLEIKVIGIQPALVTSGIKLSPAIEKIIPRAIKVIKSLTGLPF